jgi:hypothetical protein
VTPARDKNYLQLMQDLPGLRQSRSAAIASDDPDVLLKLDREIEEHESEIRKRDRHGR